MKKTIAFIRHLGAMYCPRVRERVSRPGGGGGDLNNIIYNFVEGCGLFNDTSSFEGWPSKGSKLDLLDWCSVCNHF